MSEVFRFNGYAGDWEVVSKATKHPGTFLLRQGPEPVLIWVTDEMMLSQTNVINHDGPMKPEPAMPEIGSIWVSKGNDNYWFLVSAHKYDAIDKKVDIYTRPVKYDENSGKITYCGADEKKQDIETFYQIFTGLKMLKNVKEIDQYVNGVW